MLDLLSFMVMGLSEWLGWAVYRHAGGGAELRHVAGSHPGNFGWNTDISTSFPQKGVSQFDKRYNNDVCESF